MAMSSGDDRVFYVSWPRRYAFFATGESVFCMATLKVRVAIRDACMIMINW